MVIKARNSTHRTNDELRLLGVTRTANTAISFEAGRHVVVWVICDAQRVTGYTHPTGRHRMRLQVARPHHERQRAGREPHGCNHGHEQRRCYQSCCRFPIEGRCLRAFLGCVSGQSVFRCRSPDPHFTGKPLPHLANRRLSNSGRERQSPAVALAARSSNEFH